MIHKVTHLRLPSNQALTFNMIAQHPIAERLVSLDISSFDGSELTGLLTGTFPNLKSLRARDLRATASQVHTLLNSPDRFPKLEIVDLNYMQLYGENLPPGWKTNPLPQLKELTMPPAWNSSVTTGKELAVLRTNGLVGLEHPPGEVADLVHIDFTHVNPSPVSRPLKVNINQANGEVYFDELIERKNLNAAQHLSIESRTLKILGDDSKLRGALVGLKKLDLAVGNGTDVFLSKLDWMTEPPKEEGLVSTPKLEDVSVVIHFDGLQKFRRPFAEGRWITNLTRFNLTLQGHEADADLAPLKILEKALLKNGNLLDFDLQYSGGNGTIDGIVARVKAHVHANRRR